MKAKHPETEETFYFVDKCLPFGHCISCALFQRFSDALAHMVKFLLKVKRGIIHTPLSNYLDDFLFIVLLQIVCKAMMQEFIKMCGQLGVPVSVEKTKWPSTIMIFLGVLLDRHYHLLVVPKEKRLRALNTLRSLLSKQNATVKEIQSLAGLLNFLNQAIVPGRPFMRWMYAKFSGNE